MAKHWIRAGIVAALCVMGISGAVAQASGSLGARLLKGYWIESNAFLAIRPIEPFDNPTGCAQSYIAIIPMSNPQYKQIQAAVIHAMAANKPVSVYASGCFTSWGQTWPSFYALGVDW